MKSKFSSIVSTAAFIAFFALVSFRDTGVFVKDYKVEKSQSTKFFTEGETVDILRVQDNSFLVVQNSESYEIPMEVLLRLTKSAQKYAAKVPVKFLKEINGEILDILPIGTEFQILKEESNYGFFEISDGRKGYVYMEDVILLAEPNVTKALSLVDEELVYGENKLVLKKDEPVSVKNFLGGRFILTDEKGNEYLISASKIRLMSEKELSQAANRSKSSATEGNAGKLIQFAKTLLGKPYRYATSGPNSFDCSGFTSYCFRQTLGLKLSRSSKDQALAGKQISKDQLKPGDLLFFNTTGNRISHVGIYIGDGKMIHASSGSNMKVIISPVFSGWYKSRYVTARRILN